LLAPHPTPELEEHPLSAVRDCLFNIFAASRQYLEGVSSIRNLKTRNAVVTGDPPGMAYKGTAFIIIIIIIIIIVIITEQSEVYFLW
jgi:hypothetical protein